jgi:hypothetical protein
MDTQTKQLLARWQSLQSGDGLRRAKTMARLLSVLGLVLCIFVIVGIAYGLHSAAIAIPAAALGWIIAERNALRTRLDQWPTIKAYIDWKRVQEDLKKDEPAT